MYIYIHIASTRNWQTSEIQEQPVGWIRGWIRDPSQRHRLWRTAGQPGMEVTRQHICVGDNNWCGDHLHPILNYIQTV